VFITMLQLLLLITATAIEYVTVKTNINIFFEQVMRDFLSLLSYRRNVTTLQPNVKNRYEYLIGAHYKLIMST
jgi:hypothetical protein